MGRRKKVAPTAPGNGKVRVQTILAELMKWHGVSVEDYLRMVRSRQLFDGGTDCFSSTQLSLKGKALEGRNLPHIEGRMTWRRKYAMWSLDADYAELPHAVKYWSSVDGGDAQITFQGINLPHIIMGEIVGQELHQVIEHPCVPEGVLIKNVISYPPGVNHVTKEAYLGCLQFRVEVPVDVYDDPPVEELSSSAGIERYFPPIMSS